MAARELGLARAFVANVQTGLELLYERRYDECRTFLAEVERVYPGSGVAAVGELLVAQARMLENFDFRFDAEYRAATATARTRLAAAQKVEGHEGWERLLLGVVSGIEGIHEARRGKYLQALPLAFEALDHIEAARAAAPGFVDLQLADGLYHYWRTHLTQQARFLPSFGDYKAQGIEEMQAVVQRGVFLTAPARLAMAFTWMEERQFDRARADLLANRARYPRNVINEMMLGIVDLSLQENARALATFDAALQLDPALRRVHHYRAVALLRLHRPDEAIAALKTYLAFDGTEAWQRSGAYFRLGQAMEAKSLWPGAVAAYQKAVAIDGNAGAKSSVTRLERLRKEGKIAW
jgi:tetratricopeptide (TPR) repeat protein